MIGAPILVFADSNVEYHVHVDRSNIELGAMLAQPRVGNRDYPIYFASLSISQVGSCLRLSATIQPQQEKD